MRMPSEGEPPPQIPLVRGSAAMAGRPLVQVDLEPVPGELYLIIEWPSAEMYSNQVGGYACRHPRMRGLLLALHQTPQNRVEHFLSLADWMFAVGSTPAPNPRPAGVTEYCGWCRELKTADADALDPTLQFIAPACLRHLAVDRQRLGDSTEAWVHVVGAAYITPNGQPAGPDPSREQWTLAGFRGVLTWENSD